MGIEPGNVAQWWRRRPTRFEGLPIDVPLEAFDLGRLQGLIPDMPRKSLVCRDATGGVASLMRRVPDPGLATGLEQRLSGEGLSVMLTNLEDYDPVVRALLARFVGWLGDLVGISPSRIHRPSAAFFLSSPRAISSYHDDREQNFLLHLRGSKTAHVFPREDTLASEFLKACFRPRKGIYSRYRPELEARAEVFALEPGQTLHIPRLRPHWVENGPAVSVSLSLNFFMPADFRREQLYRANDRLRAAAGSLGRTLAGQ